jgi:hypothetical protein
MGLGDRAERDRVLCTLEGFHMMPFFAEILAGMDSKTVAPLSEMFDPFRAVRSSITPELAKAFPYNNPILSILTKLEPNMVSDPFRAFYTPEMISALVAQEREAKRRAEWNVGWWKSPAK